MTEQTLLFGDVAHRPDVLHLPGALRGHVTDVLAFAQALGVKQYYATMYGHTTSVPRLEAWYGSRPYAFGGRVVEPISEWSGDLSWLRRAAESAAGAKFNSCFVNLYRSGEDSIAWHADDDGWILQDKPIVSVSFGAARRFRMRLKADHDVTVDCLLEDGDVFVMHPGTQQAWQHCVPPTRDAKGPRLNLTFRATV